MRLMSSVVRIAVAGISFLYMLLVSPHLISGGIQLHLENMRYAIYDAAIVVAFGWIPLIVLHLRADRISTKYLVLLSLLPALFVSGFFALIFVTA